MTSFLANIEGNFSHLTLDGTTGAPFRSTIAHPSSKISQLCFFPHVYTNMQSRAHPYSTYANWGGSSPLGEFYEVQHGGVKMISLRCNIWMQGRSVKKN